MCDENYLDYLLAELAAHRLDLVLSDVPMTPTVSVVPTTIYSVNVPSRSSGLRSWLENYEQAFPGHLTRALAPANAEDVAATIAGAMV